MISHRNITNLVLLFILLCGCTIYKEKIAPAIGLGDVQTQITGHTEEQASVKDRWWEYFGDEGLNRLVETALADNFDINIALLRKQAAEFELVKARSRYYPHMNLFTSVGGNYTKATDFSDTYSLPLSISYEVDAWKKITKAVEISELDIELTDQDIRAVKISLAAEIVRIYFDIQLTERLREILRERKVLQEELLVLVERQRSYGFAEKNAIIQLEQDISQTEVQIIQSEETLKSLQNSLSFLCAKTYGTLELFYLATRKKLQEPLPIPAEIASRNIYQRPDVANSFLRLQQQQKRVYIAKAEQLPSFSLSTSLSFASGMLRTLFDSDFFSLGTSAGASYSVFNGGEERAAIDSAETQYQILLIDHKKILFNALKDLEQALIANESLLRQYEEKRRIYAQSEEALRLIRRQREIGSKSRVDEITRQLALLGYQSDILYAQNNINTARITLLKAVGGSFVLPSR